MKTIERITDYETREVKETFVVCDKCGAEHKPEENHPVNAGGLDAVWCTDCVEMEFGKAPVTTVSVDDESSSYEWTLSPFLEVPILAMSAIAGVIRAAVEVHNNFLGKTYLCLKDEHPRRGYGPFDGLFFLALYCMCASGLLALGIHVIIEVIP